MREMIEAQIAFIEDAMNEARWDLASGFHTKKSARKVLRDLQDQKAHFEQKLVEIAAA
jgi:hypothetical protein